MSDVRDDTHWLSLLHAWRNEELTDSEIMVAIKRATGLEQLPVGTFDTGRAARTRIPEAILAEGKSPEAIHQTFEAYLDRGAQLIATRVTPPIVSALSALPSLCHHQVARIVSIHPPTPDPSRHTVAILSAGTLDLPVAQEAAHMCELFGLPVTRLFDVGVAGIHRLFSRLDEISSSHVVIVVAGMDGALPSVVAGLVPQPVIAVPTSVGYGASFGGIAPLLTMLNTCAPGVTVSNIDNGFGAAVSAAKIIMQTEDVMGG